ncbi:MAG: type II toxin-antitoxin system HicA family toxin [Armatimonadetes bacterium]|nr:type II toxin-antitoxin system HicA family toxin [Armatimonadota bacterium]
MTHTAKDVIRALQRAGWVKTRQRGSHVRLCNPKRPANSVTISVHSGKEIPAGTLRAILRAAGLTPAEFEELLKP